MAIKVRYGDLVMEAENEKDLKMIVAAFGASALGGNGVGAGSVTERLGDFVKRLGDDHRRLLNMVGSFPDGIMDVPLSAELGIERKALGGLLKAISRKATTAQIDSDKHVLAKEVVKDALGQRAYRFKLMPETRDALAEAGL